MTPTRPLAVVALLLATSASVPPAPASAGADRAATTDRARCQGRLATHVGRPGALEVVGTPGDDVIVSNGAERVVAGRGDDLVCTTRSGLNGLVLVDAGAGHDVVDRSGDRPVPGTGGNEPSAYASLGPGRDRYLGSRGSDQVAAGGGDVVLGGGTTSTDRDQVTLGGRGEGSALASVRLPGGTPRAGLANVVELAAPPATGTVVRLGRGGAVDLGLLPGRRTRWSVDLAAGTLRRDGAAVVRLAGVAALQVGARGAGGPALVVRGSGRDDEVYLDGGRPVVAALGGGADLLALDGPLCRRPADVAARGGTGTDQVVVVPTGCGSRAAVVDLAVGEVRTGARTPARLRGFEDAYLQVDSPRAAVIGDGRANELYVEGCAATVSGAGGDDLLTVTPGSDPTGFALRSCPDGGPNLLLGGPGDDRLTGATSVRVEMVGGPGLDRGQGEDAARDRCDTEVRVACSPPLLHR